MDGRSLFLFYGKISTAGKHLLFYEGMEYEIGPNESVTTAVVRAVSAVEGRKPCSLPTLADVLDPDALNTLFTPRFGGKSRKGGRISFVYSNSCVTVENDEYLTLQPIEYQLQQASSQEPSNSVFDDW